MAQDSNYCLKGGRKLTSVNYLIHFLDAGLGSGSIRLAVLPNCRHSIVCDGQTHLCNLSSYPFQCINEICFCNVKKINIHLRQFAVHSDLVVYSRLANSREKKHSLCTL